ncbi:MAG: methyltransferase domain-containing protein [Elusimicrobia bacterium]|nr:methyltransferase domain-containing protein [Elusimicrobiota bacterium]MBU2614870.1 methyltransferase domain-containing protein [Elusimicrobiota bacterium]
MDKQKVRQHFSSIATVYDKFASPQKKWGDKLSSSIANDTGVKTVLDIGMGTGCLAIELSKIFKGAKIYGCDFSTSMVEYAKDKIKKAKLSNFVFAESDFENMPYKDNYFDIAFSNMSLHWSSNLKTALKEALRVVKKEGNFYFTIPGKNTLQEIKKLFEENSINWGATHNFTDKKSLTSLLKELGCENPALEVSEEKISFKDFLSFLNWLKLTGANTGVDTGLNGLSTGKKLIALNKKNNSKFDVTFEILFVRARK